MNVGDIYIYKLISGSNYTIKIKHFNEKIIYYSWTNWGTKEFTGAECLREKFGDYFIFSEKLTNEYIIKDIIE